MNDMNQSNLRRDKLTWGPDVWNRIDQAVHDEAQRTKVAVKFLPLYMAMPESFVVPADTVNGRPPLTVDETTITQLVELLVEFALTPQQYERERQSGLTTAVTLVTRATNLLSQAEDLLIFQGDDGLTNPLFTSNTVVHQSGSAGTGLLNAPLGRDQIIQVPPTEDGKQEWGENTFAAVANGYARLQGKGHYGPYALVLQTVPYADLFAPVLTNGMQVVNALAIVADRVKPLVTAGLYGTGTLPPLTGILVSIGGNTMDRVVAVDAVTEFEQTDNRGRYLFRVYERVALRFKDTSGVIKFEFQTQKASA